MVGGQHLGHLTLIHQNPYRVYKCKLGQHNVLVSGSDKCQQQNSKAVCHRKGFGVLIW